VQAVRIAVGAAETALEPCAAAHQANTSAQWSEFRLFTRVVAICAGAGIAAESRSETILATTIRVAGTRFMQINATNLVRWDAAQEVAAGLVRSAAFVRRFAPVVGIATKLFTVADSKTASVVATGRAVVWTAIGPALRVLSRTDASGAIPMLLTWTGDWPGSRSRAACSVGVDPCGSADGDRAQPDQPLEHPPPVST
jgi:hypothetical protein